MTALLCVMATQNHAIHVGNIALESLVCFRDYAAYDARLK
jgi:hypothetical protein